MADTSTLNDRQRKIVEFLKEKHEVKINQLSDVLNVAGMTIRRDLEKIENLGLARRTFGGAIYISVQNKPNTDIIFGQRELRNTDAKDAIGRIAASSIEEGDSIFVDAGTTTSHFIKYLPTDKNITVVTNGMNIVSNITDKNIEKILIGGFMRDSTLSLVGPIAEAALDNLYFNKAFLSASGFTIKDGFSNSNNFEVQIKQKVITKSNEINFLVDSSKFGQQFLHKITTLDHVDRLFIDKYNFYDEIKTIEKKDVELILCE
ncbi:DeoR/GlpR family DNA-binding transcription regulator [Gracilibacillus kekensis]|uniref:Transcriptional regulator, DeoR family n=1 Tax=Gracilibacillus kekensis TaxID=1027249 RepID=A0A1M7JVY8_9BACI|nr:DeoR/GlpR family DNA-binding transcription regulator [Gracilibacillus kekensis]SHM57071.1 transcriptional regulator, DeoR family [Gracilibacillus kekensis]